MADQLPLFAPPCICRGRTIWPVGKTCDEGERLLQAKNEACYREGRIARGEEQGDPDDAARAVWQAQRAFLVHAGLSLSAYLPEAP